MIFISFEGQGGTVTFNIARIDNVQDAFDPSRKKLLGYCAIISGNMTTLVKGSVADITRQLNEAASGAHGGNGSMPLRKT